MPTYDYRCDACGHLFELFQSITAPTKRKCPRCGKSKLQRLIGPGSGVIFKGGGFYQTDYRSDNYKKGAEAEKKVREPASDAKGDAKSQATSDASAKTDAKKRDAPVETSGDKTKRSAQKGRRSR